MGRVRTLVETVLIDTAERAHNCQASSKHRILKGQRRLKVRNERSWDHYCMDCAKVMLERDIVRLQSVLSSVTLGSAVHVYLRGEGQLDGRQAADASSDCD